MVPPLAFQVTPVLEVPVTAAVNVWVAPVFRLTVAGVRLIPTVGVTTPPAFRLMLSSAKDVWYRLSSVALKWTWTVWPRYSLTSKVRTW